MLLVCLLAALRPWTIRPIETASARAFDARGYVTSVWDERVIPTATTSAVDLATWLQAPAAPLLSDGRPASRSVFVKSTAVVAEVDRRSRVGVARLRIPGVTRAAGVGLQVGPVIRGTALRDALEFIRFTDFTNQLEFASVANALNDEVQARVLAAIDVDRLPGRTVSFVGAVAVGATESNPLEIVPVVIDVIGGRR